MGNWLEKSHVWKVDDHRGEFRGMVGAINPLDGNGRFPGGNPSSRTERDLLEWQTDVGAPDDTCHTT